MLLQSRQPQVSSHRAREAAPSLLSRRAAAHPVRGGGRGGEGRGIGPGGAGEGGAGARGLGATSLLATPPATRGERRGFWASEGVAGGRRPGDHTGASPPAPSRAPGPARGPPSNTLSPDPGAPSASRPRPRPRGAAAALSQPTGAPRLHPRPFPARPRPRRPQGGKTQPAGASGGRGSRARRKGEGEETYFARRGAERCRREIKARLPAAGIPASAAVSALASLRSALAAGRGARDGDGDGAGARVARLGGRCAPAPARPGSARLRSRLPSGSWHQLRAVT